MLPFSVFFSLSLFFSILKLVICNINVFKTSPLLSLPYNINPLLSHPYNINVYEVSLPSLTYFSIFSWRHTSILFFFLFLFLFSFLSLNKPVAILMYLKPHSLLSHPYNINVSETSLLSLASFSIFYWRHMLPFSLFFSRLCRYILPFSFFSIFFFILFHLL